MKYIVIALALLGSISWHTLQSNSADSNKLKQVQVHGKVQGLQGSMVFKIEDSYLNLNAYDRFTLLVQVVSKDLLTMQVVDQPENQRCEVFKSNPTQKIVRLNISCLNIADKAAKTEAIVAL